MYGGPAPDAQTPWVQPADRYAGRCVQSNGANVLMVQSIGGAKKLNPSPTPDWGLHLSDANMPLGELVGLVRRQGAAWLAAHAPCASKRVIRLRIRGLRRVGVRQVVATVGGRPVGRSRGRRVVRPARRAPEGDVPRAAADHRHPEGPRRPRDAAADVPDLHAEGGLAAAYPPEG